MFGERKVCHVPCIKLNIVEVPSIISSMNITFTDILFTRSPRFGFM